MIARWFWREWRSPSLLIVWLALSLAVACVLALGSISDRMEKGLSQQSREFMAGDRSCVVRARYPPSGSHRRGSQADRRRAADFATMTSPGIRRSWRTLRRWTTAIRCMAPSRRNRRG